MVKKKKQHEPKSKDTARSEKTSVIDTVISGPRAHWVFFAVYLAVTVILFRVFLFGDGMLYGTDTIPDGIYTRQFYKDYHAEYGGIPRWNPLILGGMPFIDAMHGDTFYPGAWLKFYMPLTRALGHKLVWHVLLAGIFMFLFLRTLNVRREAAFLGGIMYMLAPSFVTLLYSGHDAKMYVIAFLPLALALLERGMNRPRLPTFTGLGAVMGLLILTSHVQMAYYSYWLIGLYFLFRLFFSGEESGSGRALKTGLFALAVIVALTLGAVQLLPSYRFTTTESVRAGAERTGYEYATSWSMNPEEAMGLIVPSFPGFEAGIGDRSRNTYWGRNFFKLNSEYGGILPVLFALLALLCFRTRKTWFFLGTGILSLIYSLGGNTPVYRLFYAFVPGIKNFRASGMMIFMFGFSVCVMAALFLDALFERKTSLKESDHRLLYAVGGIIVAAIVATVGMNGLLDLWRAVLYHGVSDQKLDALQANLPYIRSDLWRIVLFSGAALAGLWMFLSRKIGVTALVVLIALVAFVDGAIVDNGFIKVIDPATFPGIAPDRVVRELRDKMKNEPPFRVFAGLLTLSQRQSPNYYAVFGIESADGHHNNELQRYELYAGKIFRNYFQYWLDDYNFKQEEIPKNNFLRVAGVKYIAVPLQDNNTVLVENTAALPRAFIVHDCVVVPDDTLAVERLRDADFNPAVKAIINEECGIGLPGAGAGTGETVSRAEDVAYTRDGIRMKANCAAPGLLVVSENFVPYWHASVDGTPARIHRAYGTFMAVECPAGSHEVVFSYRSTPYESGKKMTLASLLFVVGVMAITGVAQAMRRMKRGG